MKPQTAEILHLLRQHPDGITPLDALDAVGCFRLGARVWELKEAGYLVDTELVTFPSGKRVARYRLVEKPDQLALGVVA